MMKSILAGFSLLLLGTFAAGCTTAQAQGGTFSGRVERVWEDGFRLNNGERSIVVDSYDVCGDSTARYVAVGKEVTVTGEFEGGELDAFSIVKANGKEMCR